MKKQTTMRVGFNDLESFNKNCKSVGIELISIDKTDEYYNCNIEYDYDFKLFHLGELVGIDRMAKAYNKNF